MVSSISTRPAKRAFRIPKEFTVIKTRFCIAYKYLRISSFEAKRHCNYLHSFSFYSFFSPFPLIFYYSLFIYFCLLNSFCFGFLLFSFAEGIVFPKYKQNFLPQVTVDFVRKDFLLGVILHSLREEILTIWPEENSEYFCV